MSLRERAVTDADPPGIGFRAAFGLYLGLALGGGVALAGLLVDVTTATLLGALPSTVTAAAIVGHVVAKRARGLPERIGRRRRWRLAWYLPAVGFAGAAVAPLGTSIPYTARYLAVPSAFALLVGITAAGLGRLCRNRFVTAVTADEPAVTWTYRPAGVLSRSAVWIVPGASILLVGVGTGLVAGSVVFGFLWSILVVAAMALGRLGGDRGKAYYGKRFSLEAAAEPADRWGRLHAHERGVCLDRGRSKTFWPWERIEGVELTADELVLRRRFRDLRCDRAAIEDPESVLEAIERLRETDETGVGLERSG